MSGNKPTQKLNSYTLLQLKMKEVEKSKNSNSGVTKKATKSTDSGPSKPVESKVKKKEPQKKPVPPDPSKEEHRLNPNVPDRSFGDFFCKICDSHMNSDGMWEAHITGKRHIKNVKKGDTDSKYEELDVESSIKFELSNVKDPIIGLSYIHEIRRKDPAIPAMYNCFLCHASIATIPLVIEHVIGLKHRLNFIKENETEEFELLESTNLKKNHLEPLVAETASKLEARLGRGNVMVKVEKPKPSIPYKRSYDSDEDDRIAPKKIAKPHKPEEMKVPVWSSLDIPKRDDRENENRRREKEYYDNHKNIRSYRDSVSPDNNRSRRSERDSHSRSYADDYPSRSISYPSDYLRSERSELNRHSYDRSPEHNRLLSISTRKDDSYGSSSTYTSSHIESDTHSLQTKMSSNIAPSTSSTSQNIDPAIILRDFINQLKNLPTEYFLKIVLMKLQDMCELKKTELELLMKVFSNCQQVICNNLPPQIQALFKDKLAQQSAENFQISRNSVNSSASNVGCSSATQSRMSQGGQSAEDRSSKFVNDINELLFGARKASEASSDNQQAHSTTYDHNPNIQTSSSHYPGSAVTTNLPPPPSFQPQSSNFVLPPSNFQQPSTIYPSVSNNFQQPPTRFQPPPARFQPTNEFTSTNNAPNEFTSPTNNAMSSYSSYAPYDTSLPSSGIPGLTLADRDNPQNQNYSQYKWTSPNSSNRDLSNFRRF